MIIYTVIEAISAGVLRLNLSLFLKNLVTGCIKNAIAKAKIKGNVNELVLYRSTNNAVYIMRNMQKFFRFFIKSLLNMLHLSVKSGCPTHFNL